MVDTQKRLRFNLQRTNHLPHLFKRFDSFTLIDHVRKKLKDEVSNLSETEICGTKIEEWENFYYDKFILEVPTIDRNTITIELDDVKVDARYGGDRYLIRDSDGPVLIDGIGITLSIPYQGNRELFECSGNSIYHSTPNAEILNSHLIINYRYTEHSDQKINADVKKDVDYIENFLSGLQNQVKPFNELIKQNVREVLEQRINKLNKDEELRGKLAFPLKQRTSQTPTFPTSVVRNKIKIQKPTPSKQVSTPPEPTLSDEDYLEILKICESMTSVMEKSPHAFKAMGEEDIRQHFLVQLNGRYEGSASGETFNFEGKTDILVKDGNKNVFIAECKYWKGPKTVSETIDQLLGYVSWRDTKTAIFLFSRNKNFTEVLKQIPELVKSHPNYIRQELFKGSETSFRFIFKQKNDEQRLMTVSFLLFNIPT